MKKITILALATIIFTGNLVPIKSYAANPYDKKLEQAIITIKELLNIPKEYDKFDSQVNSHGETTYFYLNWSDSKENLDTINISTDSDSNIISFNKYSSTYEESKTKLPNITREEGLQKSLEFIEKIDKDVYKSIRLKESDSIMNSTDPNYRYEFIRYINDIAFPENNITISINKYSGETTDYYANWERRLSLPSTDKIISVDEAKKLYKENIGLKLIYKTSNRIYRTSENKEKEPYYIAYAPLDSRKAIDANTGKTIEVNSFGPYSESLDKEAVGGQIREELTPEEQKSVDKLKGILEVSTIEKKAREILNLDKNYKMRNSYLNSDYKNPGEYQWTLDFIKDINQEKQQNISISLDAKTGELINFYNYKPYDDSTKPKINKLDALEIAKNYLNKINSDKKDQIEYLPNDYGSDKDLFHNFEFIRKIDGIYVENDMISIGVDSISGEVNSYNLSWYKGKLPSKEKIISIDKAYEILWNEIGFELSYVNLFDNKNPEENNKNVKLVYSINNNKPAIISGITGEILDYSGKPYKQDKIANYEDIEKSYAKEKIKVLAEYGVSFTGEEFKPKENIKQKDFVYLLWKSINPYSDHMTENDIYKEFIRMGYMTEKEMTPDEIVTKEEGIKLIIKAMNLDKVAKIDGIYKDIFKDEKDISKNLKGYMNIGYGLKIIAGDGKGNIKPKQELKREDAASMIYNYLFN
jgi:hypothetical protein